MSILNLDWHEEVIKDEMCAKEGKRATKEKMKSDSSDHGNYKKKQKLNLKNETEDSNSKTKPVELETDASVLQRRQKQIDYGKNTVGYHNYVKQVTRDQRTKDHPKTPDKYTKYSRRSWDKLIKMWRKQLHHYDTDSKDGCHTHSEEASD